MRDSRIKNIKQIKKATSYTVTVSPGKKLLPTKAGASLLSVLTENSVILRADCGGKGSCGKCQINLIDKGDSGEPVLACSYMIQGDLSVVIPSASLMSPHIISKAEIYLPHSFSLNYLHAPASWSKIGIAVDLGTTTIATYLIDLKSREILSSLSVKNPQALYGDDVISRISYIGHSDSRLQRLQQLITGSIKWAVDSLLENHNKESLVPSEFAVVGNPTMIHVLLGTSPFSIGVSPYKPQFTSAQTTTAEALGISYGSSVVRTLPQLSGFIGSDILAAAMATEFDIQPEGTLLIDLGTNGELLLKGENGYYATSCATGPAFEGANLSCGMQAIPGAIDKVTIGPELIPVVSIIGKDRRNDLDPIGICGSGIISCIAECLRWGILQNDGSFSRSLRKGIIIEARGGRCFQLFKSSKQEVVVTQIDIRNIQLGKAALISGIDFLLKEAGMDRPEKIIVAGAFGAHIEKNDLLTLGMLPEVKTENITLAGNAAGAGAIMSLCDKAYLKQAKRIGDETVVINLADDPMFQSHFVKRLHF